MSKPDTVIVRFSLTSFAPTRSRLAVVGGGSELGDWQPEDAQIMECRLGSGRLQSEPDFHWVDVELPGDVGSRHPRVEFKFIELVDGSVVWEELGNAGNRQLHLDGEKAGDVFLLPVEKFGAAASESGHTASFYSGVKERGEISVRRVTSQIFIGSCPRSTSHIDYLKSLGVTAIANFQSEDDAKKNCVAGIGMESSAHAVKHEYERRGMLYIWTPTADMCSDGRTKMLPTTSHTFAELLRSGHTIYSHCNAGVGRSVSAVCGYLTFVLGFTSRQMQHMVASSRPAAFFDFDALSRARPVYDAQYGHEAWVRATEYERQRNAASAITSKRAPPGMVTVRFSVASLAAEGTRLAIIGSCLELGGWQVDRAQIMETYTQGLHSVDVTVPEDSVDNPGQIEYKFVELGGASINWETFGVARNRLLDLRCEKTGDVFLLPVERFGELFGDHKHRSDAMAVIVPPETSPVVPTITFSSDPPPSAMGA